MQAAVNVGGKKEMTIERKINIMLENGLNVFILRWKKVHNFRTTAMGVEVPEFVPRKNPQVMQTTYVHTIQKGELLFDPDENGVPVGYMADTEFNRRYLALSFFSASFIIAGLITPSGTMNGPIIQEEIRKYAFSLGVKEPPKTRIVGVYGNTMPVDEPKKDVPVEHLDASKSVFKTEEKKSEVIPKANDVPKLSIEECQARGEELVLNRFKPFVDKLQKDKGKFWKTDGSYKNIIGPEIEKEVEKLLIENGHPIHAPVKETGQAPVHLETGIAPK